MRIFNRYFTSADLLLILGDVALAILAMGAVRAVTHVANIVPADEWIIWPGQGERVAVFVVRSFYYTDLYVIDSTMPARELKLRLINGFGLACLIVGAVGYLLPGLGFEKIYLF